MRNAFAEELIVLAEKDPKIVFLTADIGNRLFDDYKNQFPNRFFNCGVAEQNMASMAAGLALAGLRPITYTIAPFNVFRCLEQIRIDICYQNLPVIFVGTGAGLSYASLGPTHHSFEDIASLRALPNLKILCPGDSMELKAVLRQAIVQNSPVYLRIGKKGERVVHDTIPEIEIGKSIEIGSSKNIQGLKACLFTTGNTLPLAVDLQKNLAFHNVFLKVISMPCLKPLDHICLEKMFDSYEYLFSLEEHSLIGGLGSSICEWMIDHQKTNSFERFALPDQFFSKVYTQDALRDKVGLNIVFLTEKIVNKVLKNAYRY